LHRVSERNKQQTLNAGGQQHNKTATNTMYFNNSPYTVETLKKEFRTLANQLHPDHGGNEEEFKAMMAEYSRLLASLDGGDKYTNSDTTADYMRRKWAEYQAKQASEREEAERERRAEEAARRAEAAQEAERVRQAQEVAAAAVRAWADRLERIPESVGRKKRAYEFEDKKAMAAYVATTKRNIKKVIDFYFPGLAVTVNISGRIWKEEFCISWQDGPSIDTMKATAKELQFFIPSDYHSDPYADYGEYRARKGSAPWREAFGQALGDTTDIEFTRGLSEEGKQEAEEAAAAIFANWNKDTDHGRGTFAATLTEWVRFAEMLGAKQNEYGGYDLYSYGMSWGNYANNDRREDGHDVGDIYFSSARRLLREKFNVTRQPKEKSPEFVPTYGKTYKAIKKALGGNVFFVDNPEKHSSREEIELNIFEAAERLAKGEAVKIGHKSEYDGEPCIYGTDNGGGKVQEKRAAKFEAVGITLEAKGWGSIYATIKAVAINPDTLASLRAEAADIDRQRAAWEAAQNGTTNPTEQKTDTTDTDAAPADGLTLEDIPGGVAVTGDSRTTFRNRKAIKAHGARWNNNTGRWEATDPEAVESLRAWFGQTATAAEDTTTDTQEEQPAQPEQPTPEPEPEPTTDTPTDEKTAEEPTPEPPTAKNTTEDAPDLVALAAKLQEAKKAVVFCLNNPTGSVNFHGLEYWAGEVERLRKEILKAA